MKEAVPPESKDQSHTQTGDIMEQSSVPEKGENTLPTMGHIKKQHETAVLRLMESNARFELLVSSIKDYAIFMLDPQGYVLTWNQGAQRIKGYTADDIIGKHFSTFYPEEDVDWKPSMELKVVTKDGRFEDEGWRLRKDGTRFWANVILTALRDERGNLVGFGKVTRDLTDRKKTEQALKESEERFRLLVDSVKDYVIIMLSPEGYITSWNKGAERIKGYKADEVIGKHFSIFYTPEDRATSKPVVELEIARRDGKYEEEGWRVRKDGTRFWANVVVTAIRDDQQRLLGYAKVTRDLTERKKNEEILQRKNSELAMSNKELEQFAYIASHDLQEPLRTVASYVQLLEQRYGQSLDKQAHEFMSFALDGSRRMKRLIDDLLEYSRVGRHNASMELVNLDALLDTLIGEFQMSHPDATIVKKSKLPVIYAGNVYMRQLFQNLISNAIKFRKPDEPPYIEVWAESEQEGLRFAVKDNGIGLDIQYSERIFYIFQRLHTREQYSGSGVGLAICKKIVEYYKGRIWVESQLGEGATFFFTLPLATPDSIIAKPYASFDDSPNSI